MVKITLLAIRFCYNKGSVKAKLVLDSGFYQFQGGIVFAIALVVCVCLIQPCLKFNSALKSDLREIQAFFKFSLLLKSDTIGFKEESLSRL